MADLRVERGVLDTSVVIDPDVIDSNTLPLQVAVTALTMAELAAGPQAAANPAERARRQGRPQRTEAAFSPLPFAAVAASVNLPPYTSSPPDFASLDGLVEIIVI